MKRLVFAALLLGFTSFGVFAANSSTNYVGSIIFVGSNSTSPSPMPGGFWFNIQGETVAYWANPNNIALEAFISALLTAKAHNLKIYVEYNASSKEITNIIVP